VSSSRTMLASSSGATTRLTPTRSIGTEKRIPSMISGASPLLRTEIVCESFAPFLMLSIGNWCHEPVRKACATAASRNAQSGSFAEAWTWPDPGQADPAFGALHAEEACRIDIELRCGSDSHPFVGIGGRLASSSTKVVYKSEERPLEPQQLATHPSRLAFACSR
jgi:hypothetical protein